MYGMLVTSRFSDDFELKMPASMSNEYLKRILKHHVDLENVDREEAKTFIKQYDELLKAFGKPVHAIGEYFVSKFFDKVRKAGTFDEVDFFRGDPGIDYEKDGVVYRFLNGGYSIFACHSGTDNVIGEVSRVAKVRRGKEKQYIICDTRVGDVTKTKSFAPKRQIVKGLLGHDFSMSYMISLSKDGFVGSQERNQLPQNHLAFSDKNLLHVLACTTEELSFLGYDLVDEIRVDGV